MTCFHRSTTLILGFHTPILSPETLLRIIAQREYTNVSRRSPSVWELWQAWRLWLLTFDCFWICDLSFVLLMLRVVHIFGPICKSNSLTKMSAQKDQFRADKYWDEILAEHLLTEYLKESHKQRKECWARYEVGDTSLYQFLKSQWHARWSLSMTMRSTVCRSIWHVVGFVCFVATTRCRPFSSACGVPCRCTGSRWWHQARWRCGKIWNRWATIGR